MKFSPTFGIIFNVRFSDNSVNFDIRPFDRNVPSLSGKNQHVNSQHRGGVNFTAIPSPNRVGRNDPGARTVENAGGFYNVEDGSPFTSGGIGRV